MSKFLKIFGSLYFALNCLILITIFILAIFTSGKYLQFSPGWIFLLFPGIGMLSGYWIRTGNFNWARSLIIAVSLLCSIVFLFIAFVAGPQLEKLEAENLAKWQNVQTIELDKKIKRMFFGVYGSDLIVVKEQLALGVDVNVVNETQQTALHVTQDTDIARLLLEHGADIHAQDDTGTTPIFNKEIEIAKLLLDAGVDINSRNERANTLLIRYTYAGYLEGIKFLVTRGADINSCNLDHHNAMDIAEHFHPDSDTREYLKTLNIQNCTK